MSLGIETFLPVVVLTADVNDETKRRALTAGATDFLVKPFDQTEVLLRIRNLLETRRAHLLLDNQRVALEDAVRERTTGLRTAISELQRSHRVWPRRFIPCAVILRRTQISLHAKTDIELRRRGRT